jgi:hypothetical protein
MSKIPNKLYKYRSFSNLTLDILVSDRLFFADPTTFNDPLDTRPTLETDLPVEQLEQILVKFVERRVKAEMQAAAKTIRYRGPRTLSHIESLSQKRAVQTVAEIAYNATDPSYEIADPHRFLLGVEIERELLRQYDKGIVSLAERAVCPLMWSHYGDQHRGLCIGYSVLDDDLESLHKVAYGGSRLVQVSLVARMLDGDDEARQLVDDAVLLRKARSWGYEREWRLIGARGLQDAPLELEEVIFGLRCEACVEYAVIKALEERQRPVKFHRIGSERGTFRLKKYIVDEGELRAEHPRRSLKAREIARLFHDDTDHP